MLENHIFKLIITDKDDDDSNGRDRRDDRRDDRKSKDRASKDKVSFKWFTSYLANIFSFFFHIRAY